METEGVLSEGFNITELPVISEYGMDRSGTIRGKLKGVIETQTPCFEIRIYIYRRENIPGIWDLPVAPK